MGGKKSQRKMIYERFPLHYESYCEVFGGAAWVLFGLEKICRREVYNDLNLDLVNLFRCVRERTLAFQQELGFLPLKSREEYKALMTFLKRDHMEAPYLAEEISLAERYLPPPDAEEVCRILTEKATQWDVKRAVSFFKLIRYSYGSMGTYMDTRPYDVTKLFPDIWAVARRLKSTIIENKSYDKIIPHYDRPETFFYLDPPYLGAERYFVEFGWEDHVKLREILGNVQGKWLLSYNDEPEIRELYQGFPMEEVKRLDNMAQGAEKGKTYDELLISNYDTGERLRAFLDKPTLFDIGPAPVKKPLNDEEETHIDALTLPDEEDLDEDETVPRHPGEETDTALCPDCAGRAQHR